MISLAEWAIGSGPSEYSQQFIQSVFCIAGVAPAVMSTVDMLADSGQKQTVKHRFKEDKMLSMKKIWLGVIALGICVIAAGINDHWEAYRAHRWQSVQAIILSSCVDRRWTGKGYSYIPRITYRYVAKGSILLGRTVRFGPTALGQEEAYELVQRFAKDKQTVAYVDPKDKSSSVLDRDHLTSQVKWEFVDGIFLILSGSFLFYVERGLRR
jgi:hypothetical protein